MKQITQNLRLLIALLAMVVSTSAWAIEVIDVLNQGFTGVTGNSYTTFSGKTGASGAIYAGQCAGGSSSIQLRSDYNNSGIVTTASGGKVKTITVVWNSNTLNGRTLNVYGKNTAYSAATDLYNSNTNTRGTLLGTIVYGTSTELTITGDYEYIGFRSNSGALYLTSVSIKWDKRPDSPIFSPVSGTTFTESLDISLSASSGCSILYTTDGSDPIENGTIYNNPFTITTTTTVKAVAKDASNQYSEEISATYSKLSTYTISFSEGHNDIEAVEGETVLLPTLANVGDYTFVGWSETDYTTEVLTATFIAPSEAYTATKNVLFYPVYSIPQRNTENKTASLSISDYAEVHSWTDGTQFGEVIINDVITAIASSTGIYTGSYYTSNKSWRFYESDNGTLTLTISEGTLGSVTFIFEAENYGTMTYNGNRYVSGTSIPLSGKSATFGVTHTKDNNKGKIQIKNIEVVYSQQTIAYISHPRSCNVTVTTGGQGTDGLYYATYTSDYNLDFSSVDGLEAFIVITAPYEGDIVVSPVERVPAKTPVLVCGAEAKEYQVRVCGITDDVSGNQLKVATAETKGDGETIFVLAKERLGLGFYRVKAGVSLNVGKAYLQIEKRTNGPAVKSFISLGGDDANTIDALEMTSEQNKGTIYNLNGQRVIVPVKSGLYMMNGKKLMVK